ncbi:8-oxoguanine deaminase [Pseudogemmobacter humi]|uniref:8-oxoguanine deaminase n=2 Tax=Pseudogemmobacter humi TaxID=2483812 RepID=A0A3P5WAF4_9RHOB|nr:8-oxoguanine deaminase [Pseudogemmobacter humi]
MANLHSHAFQRAMAGLAETSLSAEDSFWTWRDLMYRTVGILSPQDLAVVACKLYIELMRGGFGRITEFHYLHHRPDGQAYGDRAEMSLRILEAAARTGIGLTHLPVFYAHSGFGGAEAGIGQRPFLHSVEGFLRLLDDLRAPCIASGATLGLAIHSLRAATPEQMRDILAAERTGGPIHIHVAEQELEVSACLDWSGRRPVEWLLDEMPVDARWCAIHATHLTDDEIRRLAASGAVAGLCPATEANLGDGIFPAVAYLGRGGAWGVGTDSHVATSVAEELRMLEYSQRLRDRRRNRLADGPGASVGESLLRGAVAGGARAAGQALCGICPGASADLVVLDGSNPYIQAAAGNKIIDRWLFATEAQVVRDVMVAGKWTIRDREHPLEPEIDRALAKVLAKLR